MRLKSKYPEYLDRVREVLKSNPARPGSVNHVAVLHDGWCDQLSGKGPCNCDPEIKILERETN